MGIISECLKWRKRTPKMGFDPDAPIGMALNSAPNNGFVAIELNANGLRWLKKEKPLMFAEAIMRIGMNRKNIGYGQKPN